MFDKNIFNNNDFIGIKTNYIDEQIRWNSGTTRLAVTSKKIVCVFLFSVHIVIDR